jgi:hypothetical protein
MTVEILMTVNLILALAQTFYLGMQWERHRAAASLSQEKPHG